MIKKVAIIGYSFRFPSTNSHDFWKNLLLGENLISEVHDSRWNKNMFLHPNKTHPGTSYTFASGSIGDISGFDADFFGISPREAKNMDPQQRLLLELTWESFEDAGIKPSLLKGSNCGVFIGISSADYSYRICSDLASIDAYTSTGNTASIAANRISYFFDLHGPSIAIDTACSSSLTAFHYACRSIIDDGHTYALTGSVNLYLHPYGFIAFSKASMLSKEGRCKVFDSSADGYVRSEGGAMLLLKDYDAAVSDGNKILAVVINTALNTDGSKKGLTVPNLLAQKSLLEGIYSKSYINPDEITYIECHGTGTPVGDPIETTAIGEAIGKKRKRDNPLLIGSVKSNIGHLEPASGLAGLIKSIFIIQHRIIPPTIGVNELNKNIDFHNLNLKVVTDTIKLNNSDKLIVGINSFGFGGANAHVILGNAKQVDIKQMKRSSTLSEYPFILSASSENSLKMMALEYSSFLVNKPKKVFYDIAYNMAFNRECLKYRLVVFDNHRFSTISESFKTFANENKQVMNTYFGLKLDDAKGPAFIYSGNGTQWFPMGKNLLKNKIFIKTIREIDSFFKIYAGYCLEDEINGKNGNRYDLTEIAQPVIFAIQVGITEILRSKGIYPQAVAGHSVGEIAAAWASGLIDLEQATKVIYHRSRLQGRTKNSGNMTAVNLDKSSIDNIFNQLNISDKVSIAAINSPKGVTVAGIPEFLYKLECFLKEQRIPFKRLNLAYAFHSPAMYCIENELKESLKDIKTNTPAIPFYSTVTGKAIINTRLDVDYWWDNIRKPVLFEDAIKEMISDGINIFIEIGPQPALRSYINECLKDMYVSGQIVTTMKQDEPENFILSTIANTIISGGKVDFSKIFPYKANHIDLPKYIWSKEVHWHSETPESEKSLYRRKEHPLLGYKVPNLTNTWENILDTEYYPFLKEHLVENTAVFPAACYLDMCAAASLLWQSTNLVEIDDLEIHNPILFDAETSKKIRFTIDDYGYIKILSKKYLTDENWLLNATGKILKPSINESYLNTSIKKIERKPDFDSNYHYTVTTRFGLNYGKSFQTIDYGWVDGNTIIAVYKTPFDNQEQFRDYIIPPNLVDGALQLVIHFFRDQVYNRHGVTFLPTSIGKIALYKIGVNPYIVKAQIKKHSNFSIVVDLDFYDKEYGLIAILKNTRYKAIRIQKQLQKNISNLNYDFIPKPIIIDSESNILIFEEVSRIFSNLVSNSLYSEENLLYAKKMKEVETLLGELSIRFFIYTIRSIEESKRKSNTSEILNYILTINPQKLPFLEYMYSLLKKAYGANTSKSNSVLNNHNEINKIWKTLYYDYSDFFGLLYIVTNIGENLKKILLSDKSSGSLFNLNIYKEINHRLINRAEINIIEQSLIKVLEFATSSLKEGERFNILHISPTIPTYLLEFCANIDFNLIDFHILYEFEEIIDEIEKIKNKYPFVSIQKTTEIQIRQRKFDVVIINLCFSNSSFAIQTLKNVCEILRYNGTLILINRHPSKWIDFVFGVYDDLWFNTTTEGNFISSQQNSEFWELTLKQLGFNKSACIDFYPEIKTGLYILVSNFQKDLTHTTDNLVLDNKKILILTDKEGFSSRLSEHITKSWKEKGYECICLEYCDNDKAIENLIIQHINHDDKFSSILNLVGLGADTNQISSIIDVQTRRCLTLSEIVKVCENLNISIPVITVTFGIFNSLRQDEKMQDSFHDSIFWGFTRTLMNEIKKQFIKIVDIDTSTPLNVIADALLLEITANDNEDEVIITNTGKRFVPRLSIQKDFNEKRNSEHYYLTFDMPGQINNLIWKEKKPQKILDNEIEVEVKSTGLNFRDIMYTLGLISDEALDDGFAGATLGMEFSGVVKSIGEKVVNFKVGDHVFGFAPNSFSNRLILKPNTVFHMPDYISFQSAATIPVAFFTAYYSIIHLAKLRKGEKILIHGAAGGVGLASIQVAKLCKAEIYATAGSEEKRNLLKRLGVKFIFNSRSLSYADEIMKLTNQEGIDVIVNSISGEAIYRNLQILKPFGRFIELGKRDFYENTKIGLRPFRNNISYYGVDVDQLMHKHPDVADKLYRDILKFFENKKFSPLPYTLFEANEITDAFRFMQKSKHIGKIVVNYGKTVNVIKEHQDKKEKLKLSETGTYLITGGLSGFGLKTAQWLAQKGARNLVLISRTGVIKEEALSHINLLKEKGIKVITHACDVTDKDAISLLFNDIISNLPPLKGIIHAAAIIEDSLVKNLDADKIKKVLSPKIVGALNLHELTKDMKLDFFIVYSSATTLFGNPGQANYVAANFWLETFTNYRRNNGLPAMSILWGPIDDVGFLARNKKVKTMLLNNLGGEALKSDDALDMLEQFIIENKSNIGVLRFDWNTMRKNLANKSSPKYIRLEITASEDISKYTEKNDILHLLEMLSDNELLAELIEIIKNSISNILKIQPDKIGVNRSLYEIGLDSLMAVELVSELESKLNINIPVLQISENQTIEKLAKYLVSQLRQKTAYEDADISDKPSEDIIKLAKRYAPELSLEDIKQLNDRDEKN